VILLALALPPITYILSSIARNPLVSKQPPLPPPSPLLLVLPKGAQIKLLSVEVLQVDISTFWQGISTSKVGRLKRWRYLLIVEVLYASNKNTSTSFMLILSTKYSIVEVVEIVEVSYLFFVVMLYFMIMKYTKSN